MPKKLTTPDVTTDYRPLVRGSTVRTLRGLLTHGLPSVELRLSKGSHYYRELVGSLGQRQATKGTCVWCRQKGTARPKGWWHAECVNAHQLARGVTVNMYLKPAIPRSPCALCGGEGLELDHIVPLALVWALRDARNILRAYTIGNLQWLCHECHSQKTGWDRLRINAARRGAVTLPGFSVYLGRQTGGRPRPDADAGRTGEISTNLGNVSR